MNQKFKWLKNSRFKKGRFIMNFKKTGLLVIVFAFVAVAVFAWEPENGYYRAGDGEVILLVGTGNAWGIQFFDRDGNKTSYYESNRVVPNSGGSYLIYFTGPWGNAHIQIPSNQKDRFFWRGKTYIFYR
jgi:hypothetical protein